MESELSFGQAHLDQKGLHHRAGDEGGTCPAEEAAHDHPEHVPALQRIVGEFLQPSVNEVVHAISLPSPKPHRADPICSGFERGPGLSSVVSKS